MNHFITLTEAMALTRRFRENRGAGSNAAQHSLDILPLAETFDRSAVDTIMAQPDCVSVRIYYGMSEDLKIHAILVGVNSNNQDIIPTATAKTMADTTDVIAENGMRCPDICDTTSPLNT